MQNKKIHKAKKSLGLKTTNSFVRAKKALGQNFLKSIPALNKIIEAGEVNEKDVVLEIGPGKGALTEKLLERAGCVVAVEKDRELISFLEEKFSKEISEKKLILLNEDILGFNFADKIFSDSPQKFSAENFLCPAPSRLPSVPSRIFCPQNYKIIANIPYNITGAILKKFLQGNLSTPLEARNQPSLMVLMVQHEVAKRIVAQDKKESILSVSVKAYGEPKLVMKVPARYFSPAPKVDSAIILIKNISRKFFIENKINEENFWKIIHAGFAHKRKKLSSNLKGVLKNSKTNLDLYLGNKRAEDLSLEDWLLLTKNL